MCMLLEFKIGCKLKILIIISPANRNENSKDFTKPPETFSQREGFDGPRQADDWSLLSCSHSLEAIAGVNAGFFLLNCRLSASKVGWISCTTSKTLIRSGTGFISSL